MIAFLLGLLVAISSGLQTLSLDFQRVTEETGKPKEVVTGHLYFQQPFWMYVDVASPVHQIMLSEKHQLLIFYPEQKKAFRIRTKKDNPPIFVQGLLTSLKEDYGLEEMGYTLTGHKTSGDTLITIWVPPKDKAKVLGEFVLKILNNRLVEARTQSANGKTKTVSIYARYVKIGQFALPQEITTVTGDAWHQEKEVLSYKNIRLNVSIPDSLLKFTLPRNIPVKDVQW